MKCILVTDSITTISHPLLADTFYIKPCGSMLLLSFSLLYFHSPPFKELSLYICLQLLQNELKVINCKVYL